MEHLRPPPGPESPPETPRGRASRAEPGIIQALVTDYDGTLATGGRVAAPTLAALERFRLSGRRLVLVTGRRYPNLLSVFPNIAVFDRVVSENGAVLHDPAGGGERVLAQAPPPAFAAALAARGVAPLATGRVIVATDESHLPTVHAVIRELSLPLEVILNKGAVMVLPAGTDKATGMNAALAELGLSPSDTAGVGDAENDLAFMSQCRLAVAVANALESVKAVAEQVTVGEAGTGVVELIESLLESPLVGDTDHAL